MSHRLSKQIIVYAIITTMVFGQFSFLTQNLFAPKPAQAFFPGIPTITFNTEIASPYQVVKDIALGALRTVALKLSDAFLKKFVDKLQEKYKIRDYLYYDRLLTDYYITNFIAENVDDPDLRQLFSLLNAGFITGRDTGAKDQNARAALIPRLKQKLAEYYVNQGGIDPNKIYSPPAGMTDRQYFSMARAYFANPPSFTEQNLRAQYGSFQSSATTAAQLEVLTGNGLKAGRVIGGYCTDFDGNTLSGSYTPQTCAAAPGKWNASALDIARSFIDNPTSTIDKYLTGAIHTHIDKNFDPNNFWAIIGSTLGNFFFNHLDLGASNSSSSNVFDEPGQSYNPEGYNPNTGVGIDLDGDGTNDGFDNNGDNQPDICVYGGTYDGSGSFRPGPPCQASGDVLTPSVEGQDCTAVRRGNEFGNDPGAPTSIDPANVEYRNPTGPVDMNSFLETGTLDSVNVDMEYIHINDLTMPWSYSPLNIGGTPTYASVWIFAWRNNQWIAYPFASLTGAQVMQNVPTGTIICGRPSVLNNFEPQAGETYGFMVSTPAGSPNIVNNFNNLQEKSNIVLHQWGGVSNFYASQIAVVQAVKDTLVAQGIDLASCRAFQITEGVAWQLAGDGAGLMFPGSNVPGRRCSNQFDNNYEQFIVDKIIYPDGGVIQILDQAGARDGNIPIWRPLLPVNPASINSYYLPAYNPAAGPPVNETITISYDPNAGSNANPIMTVPQVLYARPGQDIRITVDNQLIKGSSYKNSYESIDVEAFGTPNDGGPNTPYDTIIPAGETRLIILPGSDFQVVPGDSWLMTLTPQSACRGTTYNCGVNVLSGFSPAPNIPSVMIIWQ